MLAGGFAPTSPEFLLLLSWSLETEASVRHAESTSHGASWCRGVATIRGKHERNPFLLAIMGVQFKPCVYNRHVVSTCCHGASCLLCRSFTQGKFDSEVSELTVYCSETQNSAFGSSVGQPRVQVLTQSLLNLLSETVPWPHDCSWTILW